VIFAGGDVSGTWQLTVETNQERGTDSRPSTAGEQLTGAFNSQLLGETKITGSVKKRDRIRLRG
jgi:hypothetical protein